MENWRNGHENRTQTGTRQLGMAVRLTNGRARWGKTYKGFSVALAEAGKKLTPQGATILTRACEDWLKEQDDAWPHSSVGTSYRSGYKGGSEYYPWYTGNLHDSMATRVGIGSRTISIRQMEPKAAILQYDQRYGSIDGTEWGLLAANRGSHVLLPGLQAQLYIGVPYAETVNRTTDHAGYVEEFERDFASTIESRLSEIKNLVIR